MKITKIILQNFRSYRGRNELLISDQGEKNVTLILGSNNSGKTSLFEAIRWCLYNEIPEIKQRGAFVNKDIKELFEVRVSIDFTHENNKYRAERCAEINPNLDTNIYSPESKFYISIVSPDGINKSLGDLDEHDFQNIIDGILPRSISKYFIVDGDKISDFVNPTSTKVRNAIEDLLKLEHLNRISEHLESVNTNLHKKFNSIKNPRGSKTLKDNYEKVVSSMEGTKSRIVKIEEEYSSIDNMLGDVQESISTTINSVDNQKQIVALTSINEKSRLLLERNQSELSNILASSYQSFIMHTLKDVYSKLEENRDKGKIPKHFEDVFIKDMLAPCDNGDSGRCICGTQIAKNSKEYLTLLSVLQSTPPKAITNKILSIQYILSSTIENSSLNKSKIDDIRESIDELEDEIALKENKILELKAEVDEELVDKAPRLHQQKHRLERSKAELDRELIEKRYQLKQDEEKKKELESELSRINTTDQRTVKLKKKIDLVNNSIRAVDTVYGEYKQELKDKLVYQINQIFLELFTASDHFKTFTIDDDFNYDIMTVDGQPWKLHLSNAQRKLFALSFIAGLRLIADEEAPFILDSPLGIVDTAHRKNYAKTVPGLASQLILLMTDAELTEEFEERIISNVGNYCKIKYDASSNTSRFEKVELC